ncbi:MAG: hypothetical protein IJY23_03120 [Clostridia bacterium]|nr:hypothetical protein [Clostridia bacterium]
MKNKNLRIFILLLSVILIASSMLVVIASAADSTGTDEIQTHSDYEPTVMYGNVFSTAYGAAGSNTAKTSELINVSDGNGSNSYLLLRPNVTSNAVAETRIDVGLSSRVQGDAKLINLKSFKNSSGTEITYDCTTKYVVYDFDIGTETDLTDGAIFQVIARKIKDTSQTSPSGQSMAGTIDLYIADDEETGHLLLKKNGGSYIDTGVSIDNRFAHITVVIDLNEVISTTDSSKATASVFVNGKNTNLSITGFSADANYFDMGRLTMTGVASKVTDSVALDNYMSRSFGTDYNGNLASILSDSSKEITEFDCTYYGNDYEMPTVRPLAKVGVQTANTHKDLLNTAKSGDTVRYFRKANYYLPSGIDGVTEICQNSDGVQTDGVLYETFDASGTLINKFTDSDSYHVDLNGSPSFAEIYSEITVAAKSEITPTSSITVSLNGNIINYDAYNSSNHFIVGKGGKTITYSGPGTIKATACAQSTGSPRNLIYIHQGLSTAFVNIENINFAPYGEACVLRSGTTQFTNCNISWSKNDSRFAYIYGSSDGTTNTEANLIFEDSTVIFNGTNAGASALVYAENLNASSGKASTNTSKTTIKNCILNTANTNVFRCYCGLESSTPVFNIVNTKINGGKRLAQVGTNAKPTMNVINSKIANMTSAIATFDSAENKVTGTVVLNIENSLFKNDPSALLGAEVNFLNDNKLYSTVGLDAYPYMIAAKPGVKANLTLNSDFNFNFYVPKDSFISATVDGAALALGDEITIGNTDYVAVSYEGIAPATAGVAKVAVITLKNDLGEYVANYSLSIPKYITQIKSKADAGNEDSVRSVSLMAAIVNYIDSAYTCFGQTEGIDNVTALKELLATEIAALGSAEIGTAVNDMSALSDYISETAMVINSVPMVRFSLKSFTGTVIINGISYEVVDGTYNGNAYIDVNVKARYVANTITVKVGDASGSYKIAAYYNYLKDKGETASAALLEDLFIYGKYSKAYVAHVYDKTIYVTDENYHWHICTDSSCKAASKKVEHSFDATGACECGYVYGSEEETGNFLNSLGITESSRTELDDMKFAKVLNNSSVTYTFTDEEKALVNSGDVLLFSFVVKAKDVSAPINIKADLGTVINYQNNSTTMTYYAPVQWTRIYMPIKNNGMNEVTIETSGTVYIAEAKYENQGNVSVESLNLKSGMWMIDDFEKYELKATESYLNTDGATKYASAVKLSKDASTLFVMSYSNTGTFAIRDAKTGALLDSLTGLGSELRQLAITEDENYAIMTSRASGACIVDMTNKSDIKIAASYNTVELATGLYVSGNYAFITNRYHGVEVVDISDPTKPVQKANIYTGGEVQSCVVYNNYLYCGVWGECGVWIYNLNELDTTSELTRVGKVTCNGKGDGLTVTKIGDKIYMFAATGQHTYAANNTNPAQDLAFGQGNGMDIFDVTDPANPIHLSTSKIDGRYYYTGNDFWETEISYDEETGKYYAYLVNTYNGVYVYDVTNLAAPVRLAHITLPLYNGTVLKHDTRTIITTWNQASEARSAVATIAVKNGTIYIAGTSTDVHKLDNSSLFFDEYENEQASASFTVSDVYGNLDTGLTKGTTFWSGNNGQVLSVATKGDYIYVAAGSDGILVFKKDGFNSASTPVYTYAPKTVNGRVGFAVSIEIKGDRLYAAEDIAGLGVYNIGSDGKLTEIEGYRYQDDKYVVRQVRVSPNGGYAVIQLNSAGVAVIELKSDNTYGTVTVQNLSGGHLYHKNLSEVINERYIIAWNHVALTYWIDFNPQNGVDSAPEFITMPNSPMGTMVNGIAAYQDKALVMPSWNNSYRLYSDTSTYTGGFSATNGGKFSGKPTVCGNYLICTRHDTGMIYILDISGGIEKPTLIHTIDTVGNADVAYYDESGTVYIPLGNQGLLVIDLATAFSTTTTA